MKRKVLVADDEAMIIEYLASYIPLLGYDLETAQDGMEVLAKINVFKPELILLDLFMPNLDGFAVLKELKKNYPKIKILVITGGRNPIEELKSLGADDVLYKPLDLSILSERIKILLPPAEIEEGAEYARLEIVEDEIELAQCLKDDFFEPRGLEVYLAKNADEGFSIYQQKRPHIVVVDLAIPSKEQGYNLIQRLATSIDPPPPKSLLISTASFGDAVEDLKRKGYPVFLKPDYERLIERVMEACTRHGLRLRKVEES